MRDVNSLLSGQKLNIHLCIYVYIYKHRESSHTECVFEIIYYVLSSHCDESLFDEKNPTQFFSSLFHQFVLLLIAILESHLSVVNSIVLQKLLLALNRFTSHKILVLSLPFQFPPVVS